MTLALSCTEFMVQTITSVIAQQAVNQVGLSALKVTSVQVVVALGPYKVASICV